MKQKLIKETERAKQGSFECAKMILEAIKKLVDAKDVDKRKADKQGSYECE